MKQNFDIIIIGAGLIGLSAALAFGRAGLSAALIDRRGLDAAPADFRASAIAASAARMFARLDVDLEPYAQPIDDMVAYEGDVLSQWKVHFDDTDALGVMIENKHLRQILREQVEASDLVSIFAPAEMLSSQHNGQEAEVVLAAPYGKLTAKLLIAADGRNSALRRLAGISADKTQYDQRAMVAVIAHTAPHDGLALQRFMRGGPVAVLPLLGSRSQIVWSDKAEAVTALEQMGERAFIDILTERIGGYLGDISLETPLQSYPLTLQIAQQFTQGRLALIGDAAHVIHPLAGQGLNLGLRDVAALVDSVEKAYKCGQDIGTDGLLGYESWRSTDIRTMAAVTHGLNHVFGQSGPILGHLRRLGMSAVNDISPLKALFIQSAAGNLGDLPKLMHN